MLTHCQRWHFPLCLSFLISRLFRSPGAASANRRSPLITRGSFQGPCRTRSGSDSSIQPEQWAQRRRGGGIEHGHHPGDTREECYGANWDATLIHLSALSNPIPSSLPQFWMSALATTIPVPSGAFMPVFVIGKEQPALCHRLLIKVLY